MKRNHKLNVLEAFALSLATMAPTGAMAGNSGPGAKVAGINLPIAFLIASIAIAFVGASFYEMSKRIAADGSIYAYNRVSLGEHWGFVSGWILTLAYCVISSAMVGLSANYGVTVLKNLGFNMSPVLLGAILMVVAWFIMSHGVKITSNFSMTTEFIALAILLTLSVIILVKGGTDGTNVKPFIPSVSVSGIGQGVVYTILCFVGFEVACTVATRAKNPKRSIPLALVLTIVGGVVVFVFVSYAEIIGFGTNHVSQLAQSGAPLNFLAQHFMNSGMATLIDFAIFLSAFGAVVGVTNAAAYMVYAFGRKGYLPHTLGKFSEKHNTPVHSVHSVSALSMVLYLLLAVPFGVSTVYLDYITLGGLCMIVIYMLACIGAFVFFRKHADKHYSLFKHGVVPVLGTLILIFPLVTNIYPVPAFPLNIIPYFIIIWGVFGYLLSRHHTKKLNQ